MGRRRPLLFPFSIALIAVVLLLAATSAWWLPVAGRLLIHDEGPAKADIAVVLAGDSYGHRILRAGELIREGYVPEALVSGPRGMYGYYECDLAIPFATHHGYPAEWFIPSPNHTLSTRDEAAVILPELHRRNVHRVLLVTSDYHTARAARIFRSAERKMGGGMEIRPVAAPDEYFRADSWWRTRQGQKIVLEEWAKTVASAIGL